MPSMNLVVLLGHLGADAEFRATAGGMAMANLRLATSERRKDKNGEWGEHTEWHSVTVFGKSAEWMEKDGTGKKGALCHVKGRIQTRTYEKDGRTVYRTEIIAEECAILGAKGGAPKQEERGGRQTRGRKQEQEPEAPAAGDDDIPF